jgi:hypothetical protein
LPPSTYSKAPSSGSAYPATATRNSSRSCVPSTASFPARASCTKAYGNTGVPTDLNNHSGSGITLGSVDNGTIERSVVHDDGRLCQAPECGVGIWAYDSRGVTIQFDESYRNQTGGTADGDGFDLDQNTSGSVVQYSYSHDNDGAGFLLYSGRTNKRHTGNTIRYNVSQNGGRTNDYGGVSIGGNVFADAVYNNTVYLSAASTGDPAGIRVAAVGGAVTIRNNILQVEDGLTMVTAPLLAPHSLRLQQNDYHSPSRTFTVVWGGTVYASLRSWRLATGQERLGSKATGVTVDPRLVDPGGGGVIDDPDRLATLTAYELRSDTPLLGLGLDLEALFGIDMGGRDYFGVPVPSGNGPELGAAEVG